MNREEAIEKLEAFAPFVVDDTREAIDMAIEALQALQGKPINCNYTCSDCVHQDKAYEEEPCHSCFNNDGAGYEPEGYKPVKHGEWIKKGFNIQCSRCNYMPCFDSTEALYNYCPNCGAKMRGDEE